MCKQSAKELAGDDWTLGDLSRISTEDFWTWVKLDTIGYDGHSYLAIDKFFDFERELWFVFGKCMWRKHWIVYQDYMKYVRNDIVKPFRVKILRYAKCVQEMHELAKYLPPPSMKGESAMTANWGFLNKEFTTGDIQLAISDRIPKSMRDEFDNHL